MRCCPNASNHQLFPDVETGWPRDVQGIKMQELPLDYFGTGCSSSDFTACHDDELLVKILDALQEQPQSSPHEYCNNRI
ncbi:hypothetical protein J6590_033545 [Homalodisca vitripennis]|nr:hypothetical protein J6590_033545 [Homalodisca vitripennis]